MVPGFLITAKTVRGYVRIFQLKFGTSTSQVQMVRLSESDMKAFHATVLFLPCIFGRLVEIKSM